MSPYVRPGIIRHRTNIRRALNVSIATLLSAMCDYPTEFSEPYATDTVISPPLFLFSAEEMKALGSLSKPLKVGPLGSGGTRFKPPGLQAGRLPLLCSVSCSVV